MVKAAGANTFDAILFAVNETKPRLVKIPWKLIREDKDDPTQYQKLDTNIWFKRKNKDVKSLSIYRWGINGPELGRGLCFIYDENVLINGSPLNRCIVDVTGGRAGHQWCGNILALRMGGSNSFSYDFYKNVDMQEDLKPLVTYFEEYGKVMPVYQHSRGTSNHSRGEESTILLYFWKALLYSVPIGFFWYLFRRG